MSDYYVDLGSPGAWNGRGGTDHIGDEWLGLSGLQKAADTVTAGNTINIKGTAICTNLLDVSHDAWSGTALTIGEACSWDSGGTGVVSEPNTSDVSGIAIERLTGNNPIDNETITGTTSGQTVTIDATASSVKATGLDVDTNSGSVADGLIKYIGVNSSWVNDGTRCKLDGNAGSIAGCLDIVTYDKTLLYSVNIEADDADNIGFKYGINNYFINCWAHHCDSHGFHGYRDNVYIRCLATNNVGSGIYNYSTTVDMWLCVAHNNTVHGFRAYSGGMLLGNISAENGNSGIYTQGHSCVIMNTLDENVDGIQCYGGIRNVVMFNRITNQTDDGIVATSGELVYEDWNLFYGNVGLDRDDTGGAGLIEQGGNSKDDGAGDGYTDQAGHDFNLTDSADYRREAITLPKWDGTSP